MLLSEHGEGLKPAVAKAARNGSLGSRGARAQTKQMNPARLSQDEVDNLYVKARQQEKRSSLAAVARQLGHALER